MKKIIFFLLLFFTFSSLHANELEKPFVSLTPLMQYESFEDLLQNFYPDKATQTKKPTGLRAGLAVMALGGITSLTGIIATTRSEDPEFYNNTGLPIIIYGSIGLVAGCLISGSATAYARVKARNTGNTNYDVI